MTNSANLVIFTEEILNGKLHLLYSASDVDYIDYLDTFNIRTGNDDIATKNLEKLIRF